VGRVLQPAGPSLEHHMSHEGTMTVSCAGCGSSRLTVRNLYRSGICVREFVPFLEVSRVCGSSTLDTRACMWNLPPETACLETRFAAGLGARSVGGSCDRTLARVAVGR
jgi:hypothetical protein